MLAAFLSSATKKQAGPQATEGATAPPPRQLLTTTTAAANTGGAGSGLEGQATKANFATSAHPADVKHPKFLLPTSDHEYRELRRRVGFLWVG